jgi:signal transduction histidine kinase
MNGWPAEILAGWPIAASLALAITAGGMRAGRRRTALNEALHELRRPLQAIALALGRERGTAKGIETSLQIATAALERLDREINGGDLKLPSEAVAMRALLESAVARWKGRAALGGGSLMLHWHAGVSAVAGEGSDLAQAIDNLIINAIEHGGPSIVVEARCRGARMRIAVADSGRESRPESRWETPAEAISRLTGRRRRGHGLKVVRRVAAAHGGRFVLRRGGLGTLAMLELPLIHDDVERAA